MQMQMQVQVQVQPTGRSVVGNISALWMYTTAKLAARESFPSSAREGTSQGRGVASTCQVSGGVR